MSTLPPVSVTLTELGIPHRVFAHTNPVRSLEQAAAERDQVPGQVVRSLLFRLGEGDYLLVLAAGPAQVSWKALRTHVGQSRLTMAGKDEVLAVTGYAIGTVSPIGLATPLPILVDRSVTAHAEISLGSGQRNTGIIMATADLMDLLGDVEMVELLEAD